MTVPGGGRSRSGTLLIDLAVYARRSEHSGDDVSTHTTKVVLVRTDNR